MNQMRNFFAMASAAAILASCSQNENVEQAQSQQIKATSSIEGVATKAVIGTDAGLAGITFLRMDYSNGLPSTFDFSTATAIKGSSRATDGDIVWGSLQSYVGPETTVMRGYTTEKATETDGSKVVWSIDGATDILLTDVWNAGVKISPISTGMIFKHQLSRIEVICQGAKASTITDLRTIWGDITSIKLVDSYPELTFDYATNAITPSGTKASFALLKGTAYDAAQPFEKVELADNGATNVCGSAMICPQRNTVKLEITTTNKTARIITTTLNALERAKIHTITLSFGANGQDIESTASTIEDWTGGSNGAGNVPNNP